jgi:NADP-dependent 3-hydroxy acid dehydrogenase YdfG
VTSLADQVAVVSGASSGIGRAIALGLAAQGASVCLLGRDLARLQAVAEAARECATRVFAFQIDLRVDAEIARLTDALRQEFEHVDLLVHSAGEHRQAKFEDASIADLDALYSSNVRAPYVLTQHLLPMLKASGGQIVFVNSSVGQSAPAGAGQFAATQHAIKGVADSLRQEVNGAGVRVLNVFLGRTATPRQARIYEHQGWGYQPELLLQPEDVASMVVGAVSLSRTAEVTEITMRPAIKSY